MFCFPSKFALMALVVPMLLIQASSLSHVETQFKKNSHALFSTLNSQPSPSAGKDEGTDVPMLRANEARTGEMPGPDPIGEIGELWSMRSDHAIASSPAVVDGTVFIGIGGFSDSRGAVVALDAATGAERWRYDGFPFVSSPAVAEGRVYVASVDGHLYAFRAIDGQVIHRLPALDAASCTTGSSPVVSGVLVIVSFGCFGPEDIADTIPWSDLSGYLVAYDTATGSEVWRLGMSGFDPMISPAVSGDVALIADSRDADYATGTVYAVEVASGAERWRFDANTGFVSTPAIHMGIVLVVGWSGDLYALDLATGSERWRFKLGSRALHSPAAKDGMIFVGNSQGTVFGIDAATGQVRWDADAGGLSASSPVVTDSTVYVGGWSGFLSRIDATTGVHDAADRIQIGRPPQPIDAAPIVSQGRIYVATSNRKLIVLGDVRELVPIDVGSMVEVRDDGIALRAAPSNGAVNRGDVLAGTILRVVGPAEEREEEIWWLVEAPDAGQGWIPEDAIVAVETTAEAN
jgi:outer membrane protein assembly factor BamB